MTDDTANTAVRWEQCGGYPSQQWALSWADNVGNGSAHSGYMIQPANDPARWMHDLGANGWTATGNITGTRPDRGIVIDNYSSLAAVVSNATPVVVTGPSDSEITLRNPQFTGTGDDGAQVSVHDADGRELCRTTVVGGVWDCASVLDLADGPLDATATQLATDNTTSIDTVSIIVADPLNSPVIDPMLAGGAGVAILALAGAAVAARRKRAVA